VLYVPRPRGRVFCPEELKKYLPQARVGGYERASLSLPEADIIVATQAVFRYRGKTLFDFAAVLDIDYEFHKGRPSGSTFGVRPGPVLAPDGEENGALADPRAQKSPAAPCYCRMTARGFLYR